MTKLRLEIEHGEAGLWYVTSPDLRGLLVAEHSRGQALEAVDAALIALEAAVFAAGVRVHHRTQGLGTVESVTEAGAVRVVFDKGLAPDRPFKGEYDDVWFRVHPGWLTLANAASPDAPAGETK